MKKILSALVILFTCSCIFQPNTKQKMNGAQPKIFKVDVKPFIKSLPAKLDETSGIIYYDDLIWSFNDSGGKNILYGFNRNGKIKKEIEIKDVDNHDWESITQDKKHIYIGDFGNNNGSRKNLSIIIIDKKDIKNKSQQKVKSKTIKFNYNNQKAFHFAPRTTPFDCEAMLEFNKYLYLFTKDWRTRTTTVYKMPAKNGDYQLTPIDSFNVDALITGADISSDKKTLALVAYKNFKPVVWIYDQFENDNFFSGKARRFELDSIYDAQTEGICFLENDTLLISCERTSTFAQQVFYIDLKTVQ